MKKFEYQTKYEKFNIVVIDEYLKFQNIRRDFEVMHAYRSGYWNCYIPTVELIRHLEKYEIGHHLTNREQE
jgi:hypothetical protein